METWKPITVSTASHFEVSSLGRVRNPRTRHILTQHPDPFGYLKVGIAVRILRTTKTYLVHLLVAKAFLTKDDSKPWVDHINRRRSDNRAQNLRWVTLKEQMANKGQRKARLRTTPCSIDGEVWKQVSPMGIQNLFASSMGRVKMPSGHVTFGYGIGSKVYPVVRPRDPTGKLRSFKVHVLVALAFLGSKPCRDYVTNHKDHDRKNNRITNLEYVTAKENASHSYLVSGRVRNYRPVAQLDLEGKEISRFPSLAAAGEKNGMNAVRICHACNGRSKTAGGFKWCYL